MSVVVVAGGLGDPGRLITDALVETGKHEVYVMSRKTVQNHPHRVSPLTGERYTPIIQTNYSSEDSLVKQLTEKNVGVVICTFIMDSDPVCDAELRLIRAANRPSVRRFIPSEFNVEYDVLPYPEKKYLPPRRPAGAGEDDRARVRIPSTRACSWTILACRGRPAAASARCASSSTRTAGWRCCRGTGRRG
ncbi:hypothetical protein F4809DRAFT_640480 [Biscogniauxia mediterranea]|nr:hypothetical protein F4809DRAFT_640480 [Biscogniauxia mediterranea]